MATAFAFALRPPPPASGRKGARARAVAWGAARCSASTTPPPPAEDDTRPSLAQELTIANFRMQAARLSREELAQLCGDLFEQSIRNRNFIARLIHPEAYRYDRSRHDGGGGT